MIFRSNGFGFMAQNSADSHNEKITPTIKLKICIMRGELTHWLHFGNLYYFCQVSYFHKFYS